MHYYLEMVTRETKILSEGTKRLEQIYRILVPGKEFVKFEK